MLARHSRFWHYSPSGLGERRELPSGVRGEAPAAIAFLHVLSHITLLVARKLRFSCPNSKVSEKKIANSILKK